MSTRTMILVSLALLVLYAAGMAIGALIAVSEVAGRVGTGF